MICYFHIPQCVTGLQIDVVNDYRKTREGNGPEPKIYFWLLKFKSLELQQNL